MKRITTIMILLLIGTHVHAQSDRQLLDFEFEGVSLNGVLNLPENQNPKGLVLLIHGSGRTDAVAGDWYSDIRETFVQAGYAIYMWDKMGCGKSGGTFDNNQSVYNSADEAIAAINTLKERNIPGSNAIGLYGGSRGSWVNPIVISQYKDIEFWISVSGVDDKENFGYFLEQNLRIEGMPEDSIDIIVGQWFTANKIFNSGGSFETYMAATKDYRNNAFLARFNGETPGERDEEEYKERYYRNQPAYMKERLDEETGLQIVIEDFDALLSNVSIPVLALFGENDRNVDWRKTKRLYERTLGPNTDLTVQSFPGCSHSMRQSKTGGHYEFHDSDVPFERCNGFLEAIEAWLGERQ